MRPLEYLGSGRNREVYRRGNYVIKVPRNWQGIVDNEHEADVGSYTRKEVPGSIQYARCRLHPGGILVMQYAQFVGPGTDPDGFLPHKNGPSWMGFVDCGQVGYNRFGKVVAYDYGRY